MASKKNKKVLHHQPKTSKRSIFERNLKIALFVFGLLLYGSTINHGYVLDDVAIINANQVTQQGFGGIWTHITHGYWYGFNMSNDHVYRPLTPILFCIEYEFFGENPAVSHFLNVLIYALTGIVLYMTLRLLFKQYNYVIPLVATLLFIAHPIHTESVSNIKSRDEILGFLGGISALYFLLRYVDSKTVKYLLLSCLCFFLGITGKESAITFVGIIPLALLFIRKLSIRRSVTIIIPLIVTALMYLIIRASVLDTLTGKSIDVKTNTIATAETFMDKKASAIEALGRYFLLLVFPISMSHDYSYNQIPVTNWADIYTILSAIFYLGLLVFLIKLFFKPKLLDNEFYGQLGFGIGFFFVTVSIISNVFLLIGANLAERFMFTPSFGYCMVLAAVLVKFTKADIIEKNFKLESNSALLYSLVIVLVAFSYKTYSRSMDWKNNETLFRADILTSPNSSRVNNSLSSVLVVKAKEEKDKATREEIVKEAIRTAEKAIEIYPKYRDAHYNLGTSYGIINQNKKAVEILQICVAMDSLYKNGYYNLGVIYNRMKAYDQAIFNLKKAARLDVNNPLVYNNLAEAYKQKGLPDKAIHAYKQNIRINPYDENAYSNIARLHIEIGNMDEGISYLKKLIQISPNNVDGWFNLGIIYQQKGNPEEAKKYLNKAFELNPKLRDKQKN